MASKKPTGTEPGSRIPRKHPVLGPDLSLTLPMPHGGAIDLSYWDLWEPLTPARTAVKKVYGYMGLTRTRGILMMEVGGL
jgi:hypothetical protein